MKYNNFKDWLKQSGFRDCNQREKDLLLTGWDVAVDSYLEDPIAIKIKELLTTINDAEKIDCTCDRVQIASGYQCGCGRGQAIQRASIELGNYLRELRKGLK